MQVGLIFNNNPRIMYYNSAENFDLGTNLIVNTARGLEFGAVVKVKDGEAPEDLNVVRKATEKDAEQARRNYEEAQTMLPTIKSEIIKFNLQMKVCLVEFTFDKEKIIINYTSEGRVDFRELVKSLASKLRVRIEMHQVGNRDEVQCMGAMGPCGRECCCKAHLNDFDKVTIKMAKVQGLSLNPTKLNGMCGKLMCCLKYEDDYYMEIYNKMPKIGQRVMTEDGEGEVKGTDILKEEVEVMFTRGEEVERKTYPLQEIKFSKLRNSDE